jgi:AcrR family transcriptional regulator
MRRSIPHRFAGNTELSTAKEKPIKRRRGTSDARERIFNAAVALVCAGGPAAATARAICDKAEVTAPTLYHYFGDLNKLYNEVLELMYVPEAQAHPGKEFSDPRGMIDYMWECCVGTATTKPELIELKNQMLAGGDVPESMVKFYARLERAFIEISQHEKLNFSPEVAATMYWAAATGIATRIAAAEHNVSYPKGAAEALKHVLLNAIFVDYKEQPVPAKTKRSTTRAKRPAVAVDAAS